MVRLVIVVAVVCLWAGVWLGASQAGPRGGAVGVALEAYAARDFDAALGSRPFDGHTVESAIRALEAWVGPMPVGAATPDAFADWQRRGRVAARFALDVMAQREVTREFFATPLGDPSREGPGYVGFQIEMPSVPPSDHDRFTAPLVAWACAHMPTTGPLEDWEHWWWMTSIGLLQGAGEWRMLGGMSGERQQHNEDLPAWHRAVFAQVAIGHLAEAEARLGFTPRLRLARAVVASAPLTDRAHRFTIGGGASAGVEPFRPDVLRSLEETSRTVNSGRFAEVERQLEPLLAEPSIESEVALRLAQLRVIRRDWAATTRWLDRAERVTNSDIERATIDYLRGWMFERTGKEDEALERYRAAYDRFRQSPNLNTLLAAQLMRVGRRTEAAHVLETFMLQPFDHGRRDLWRILVDGDAQHTQTFARRMREAR